MLALLVLSCHFSLNSPGLTYQFSLPVQMRAEAADACSADEYVRSRVIVLLPPPGLYMVMAMV